MVPDQGPPVALYRIPPRNLVLWSGIWHWI
jgi:hypothetical protein